MTRPAPSVAIISHGRHTTPAVGFWPYGSGSSTTPTRTLVPQWGQKAVVATLLLASSV